MDTPAERLLLAAIHDEFLAVKATCEKALDQLDPNGIRWSPDPHTNSVAVIIKHLAGNLRSRFTDLLTTDGEKPWRRRDDEFVDDFPPGAEGRAAIIERWQAGWSVLLNTLAGLTDADLSRTVTIRGEPHSVARALARSLAHAGYHCGQIVTVARMATGPDRWRTVTIPVGQSQAFNDQMFARHRPSDASQGPRP
ncbi:MAG: DUF1572 domain-containing protein [Planctomycetaceae bacterium]|jgi:hypothetical protein|nr:DUF1572 family protein [Phycisphaerales bacterium]MCE2653892.1 DUF1572 domain-containing protein [Planctomycetaceae bacterium]